MKHYARVFTRLMCPARRAGGRVGGRRAFGLWSLARVQEWTQACDQLMLEIPALKASIIQHAQKVSEAHEKKHEAYDSAAAQAMDILKERIQLLPETSPAILDAQMETLPEKGGVRE